MLIRREQVDSLGDARAQGFENEMCEHAAEFSPAHCEVIGEPAVRNVVRRGITQSAKYNFTFRGPIRLYLDLTFMFGSEFDTDPVTGWAEPILKAGGEADQMDRAGQLHARALEFAEQTAGPDHSYAKRAFRRARTVEFTALKLPPGDFQTECLTWLRDGYPEKFDTVGEATVRKVIAHAVGQAAAHGVSGQKGEMMFAGLQFAVGKGFAADPLYPWISRTLNNEAVKEPPKRLERLHKRTMTYLDHVIANLG